ncbi:hypothetical protein B566_EDAN002223 [Ephemera danica]|nr:hypothetical protein B566_EDAN002223 [Ephemera danica]
MSENSCLLQKMSSPGSNRPRQLRVATYLCPSLPVELFQLIVEFLEDELGCEASLQYEWRASGPLPNRADPFLDNTIDLAFVSVPAYDRLTKAKDAEGGAELLPVATVFKHEKNTEHVRGYYSDIVVHVDRTKHIKEFLDLRGCTWAYSNEDSLSGKAGSHLNALQMVRSKQADAAAVDANALALMRRQHGGDIEDLHTQQ